MNSQYIRSVRVLAATEVVLRLRGLVLIPVLSKHFGAVNYGVWAQVSVIVSMLGPVLALGLDSAVLRFLPGRQPEEIARGFSSVVAYVSLASLALAVILWLAARPISSAFFGGPENARFVAICGASILVSLLINQCRNYFRVVGSARGYAVMALVQGLTGMILGVLVALTGRSVWALVLWTLLADAALLAVAGAVIVRDTGVARPDWTVLRRFARYGLPLVPAGYAMWVLNSSDRLYIGHYGTLADLGVYALVYSLGYALISIIFNPLWVMYPSSAAEAYNRGDMASLSRLFRGVTNAALGLLLPATVALGIMARPLVGLLATREFVRGAPLLPVITLAYVCHMTASLFDVNLGLAGKQFWSTVNITAGMAVNLAANFLMVPLLGITGAAITTLLGFAIQLTLSARMARRHLPLPFDWAFCGKSLVATAVMAAAIWFLPTGSHAWMLGVIVLVGCAVYVGMMTLLRAVSREELQLLAQMIRPAPVAPDTALQPVGAP